MLLKDRLAAQGSFLFRWRGVLPLLLVAPAITALPESGYFDLWLGERAEGIWDVFCLLLAFAGLGVRIATVGFAPAGTSGRNTEAQRADVLNTSGLYSIVRNPLYLGNAITALGFLFAVKVWWFALVALAVGFVYYERIVLAEESYLLAKFGPVYRQWAARTPAWLPRFRQWRRPELAFSPRTVLRREYHGFYLIVVVMTAIEILTDIVGEHEDWSGWLEDNPYWIAFFAVGTLIYATLRLIRKTTPWLTVGGR